MCPQKPLPFAPLVLAPELLPPSDRLGLAAIAEARCCDLEEALEIALAEGLRRIEAMLPAERLALRTAALESAHLASSLKSFGFSEIR